jgi:hypothetical protein
LKPNFHKTFVHIKSTLSPSPFPIYGKTLPLLTIKTGDLIMKTLTAALALSSLVSFSAMAVVDVKVPAKDLVEAAQTLVPQNGPYYSVKGNISCTSINTGWGPATSNCEISIHNRKAIVENPDKIINATGKTLRRGPYYTFKGTFTVTSETSEIPPYKVTQTARVVLK